jgi:hypothetical protein
MSIGIIGSGGLGRYRWDLNSKNHCLRPVAMRKKTLQFRGIWITMICPNLASSQQSVPKMCPRGDLGKHRRAGPSAPCPATSLRAQDAIG